LGVQIPPGLFKEGWKVVNKIIEYIRKIYLEMRKVTWPSRSDLVNSTIVVIVISAIVAVIIFALDTVFSTVISVILR
jgi:preprotein translocase subunit SecE